MAARHLGLIDTPYQGKRPSVRAAHALDVTWCADNGAYTDRWEEGEWWAWLTDPEQTDHIACCLFATAPDVVGDAAATAVRSTPWLDRIRALGYPVAYVAQDGLRSLPWDAFDVLFLGGTTAWKLGPEARAWTEVASSRGVPVHMGRVNSARRYAYARAIGCSSVDGTYLTFGPRRRLPDLLSWTRQAGQPGLF